MSTTNSNNIRGMASIELAGRHSSQVTLKRIVNRYNIKPVGTGAKGSLLYDVSEVENAVSDFFAKKGQSQQPDDEDGANELFNLRKLKIKKEIEALTQDIKKKDLQIEQLKLQLVDTKEALQYFTQRKSVESAILRRIFLTQMPIEVTGLDPAKARAKGEHYYNEIMKVVTSTIDEWADIYNLENEGIKETIQTTPESS